MYVFLSGAEMQPERVRGTWPEARFVARGRLDSPSTEEPDQIWGIIIEIPLAAIEGDERQAASDDGRIFAVVAPPPDDGDGAAVIAAARYWELPPSYVRRLVAAAPALGEESSDG